jgi:hypothetical protein
MIEVRLQRDWLGVEMAVVEERGVPLMQRELDGILAGTVLQSKKRV